jgi:ABC-type phosphate transport system substrate-binding protein
MRDKGLAIVFAFGAVLAFSGAGEAFADVLVVVSAKSSVSRLSASQVAKIFLAKSNSFPDGSPAVPLDQPEGSAIRNEFYLKVTGKDAAQLKAYWAKIIFSGDGQPPRLLNGDEAVKRAVARDENAIGYINRSALDDSVKVVLTPEE